MKELCYIWSYIILLVLIALLAACGTEQPATWKMALLGGIVGGLHFWAYNRSEKNQGR